MAAVIQGNLLDEDDMSDGSDESDEGYSVDVNGNEPQERTGHVAVHMHQYIVVFGGYVAMQQFFQGLVFHREEYLSMRMIWMYNLDTELWKYLKVDGKAVPRGTSGGCAIAIGSSIYLQGGHTDTGNTNAVWKLSITAPKSIEWTKIEFKHESETPSPRDKHCAWEYDDKMWTFGGFGPPTQGYLKDFGDFLSDGESNPMRGWNNQLHCFDPSCCKWTILKCQGAIPSPRAAHGMAKIGDKVLLFGGRTGPTRLGDLYQLDMLSLVWTQIQTCGPTMPIGRSWHSFNALNDHQVVLHGGYSANKSPLSDTWILDLASLSWRRYSLAEDHVRLWHTGTTGCNSVIIFGGCQSDILDHQQSMRMCNDVFCVRVDTETLLELSLRAVFDSRSVLQAGWQTLPKHLSGKLHEMSSPSKALADDMVEESEPNKGMMCTIA